MFSSYRSRDHTEPAAIIRLNDRFILGQIEGHCATQFLSNIGFLM